MKTAGGKSRKAGFNRGEAGDGVRTTGCRQCAAGVNIDDCSDADGSALLLEISIDAEMVSAEGAYSEDSNIEGGGRLLQGLT